MHAGGNEAAAGGPPLPAWAGAAVKVVMLALVVYLMGTTYFGYPPNIRHRTTALGMCLLLGFLLFRADGRRGGRMPWYDWLLLAGSLAACVNVYVRYWDLMLDRGSATDLDYALGGVLVIAILELSRRCIDNTFTILVLVFVVYALFGHLLPGRLGHAELDWQFLIDNMYVTTNGIWGELMAIFVEVIALFLVFSAVMIATGADRVIIAAAAKIGGRFRGGPAKICVISSALIGMISGSSVTNAAMVGNVTIPMMKRIGYKPEVAAGIEATASSGGQITPPMMGAGLFLMAQLLNVGLVDIMVAAAIPAFLYYVGVLAAVHFDSIRDRIDAVAVEDVMQGERLGDPRIWVPVALPFALLIWLVIDGYSIEMSVVLAIVALIAAVPLAARSRADLRGRLQRLIFGLFDAAQSMVIVAVLLAASAVLVGLMDLSGVGVKLTELTLRLSSGHVLGTLVLSGLIVLVLGLGLPTTASYLIAAAVGAATLEQVGLTPLQAHMFLFYFAALSAISPPVAPAVLVAAGIAGASPMRAMWETMRIASIKYVLPFAMAFNQALLMQGSGVSIVLAVAGAVLGAVFMSAAFSGYLVMRLNPLLRLACLAGAAACFYPPGVVTAAGAAVVAVVLALNWATARRGAVAG
ncbi:MAG: TRAP transporter fused permease subunit [Alphaproteobacteria bacterium]|nr:TRAP transporter fused permease subunit [Alphaproteobacteria bacterium]